MNRKSRFFVLFAFMVVLAMVFATFVNVPLNDIKDDSNSVIEQNDYEIDSRSPHGTRAGSNRTVLIELFTNTGCPPCANANPPLNELMDAFSQDEMVLIGYHGNFPDPNDPFYIFNTGEEDDREAYYFGSETATSYPTMEWDGVIEMKGAGGDQTGNYNTYKNNVQTRLGVSSPMTITLQGSLDTVLDIGTVNAKIDITDTLPGGGDLKIRFAVVEDNRYYLGGNGEVRHRNVMKDMLTEETLPLLSIGQSYSVSRAFPLNALFDLDAISVIVFVQNDNNEIVLQAASYDYIPQKILVVDDDESSHPNGYEDDYLELLTLMGKPFDGWVHDERGSPTAGYLENYEAVIWLTGTTSSNTLTAADQTAISGYFDNARGGLFLNGEDIGFDIGSTSFFWDYLHAFYSSDTTTDTEITGVSADPISDPYFMVNLPITGGSPSRIDPWTNASTAFYYSPSYLTAAIKAGHDIDSRVVYFPFLYFEGGDSTSNKMDIMERVLNWLVVKVDYVQIRDSPGDSGNVVTNIDLDVGETVTLWGAAYNNAYGFLENYPITTWTESSGGSLVTISNPGASTLVTAGMSGGSVTLTMDYFSVKNTTAITINDPTPNYLKLTNSPNGVEIPNISLLANEDVTIYASIFNDTSGYIGLADANWDDSLGLGSFDNASGTSTTFTAGIIGGVTTITGDYPAFSVSDSFDVTVIDAVVDYLQIRDAPGDSGIVKTDIFLNVGESEEVWCAAYNISAGFLGNSASTQWNEDSGGTLITIPGSGGSIIVTALLVGGSTTLYAAYGGNQESIPVVVFPPQIDYVQINYEIGASGTAVVDPIYPVGSYDVYYGASYNNTALYLNEVPITSTWDSTNDNIVSVTTQGSSSQITVSDTQYGPITLTLSNGQGQTYQTTITVLQPTVDYMQIRDGPNEVGDILTSLTYDVGDEDTYYSACYNDTAGYLGDLPVTWDTTNELVGNITGSGPSVNFKAVDMGTCDISADFGGLVDITISITIVDITPPTADAGEDGSIKEEETFSFDASDSFDNGKITSYFWDFGDKGTYLGTSDEVEHVYQDPGIYTAKLTVTDSAGNEASDEITVTVWDITAPTAVMNLQGNAEEGVPYFFDGGGSSDNVGIETYIWNFGDGNQYSGSYSNVTHIYEMPGTYTVKLTVKDAAGHEDFTSSEISVIDTTSPATPKGLKVDPKDDGSTLEITWDAVTDSDLDHYELYVSINGGPYTKVKDIDKAAIKYPHNNLEMETSYKYYIKAVDTADNPSSDSTVIEGFCDIDSDSDGIFDLLDDDDDDDGLSDYREIEEATDPKDSDSDGDNHLDGDDAFPLDKNEWKDTDFDGVGDSEDAFPKDASEWLDSDGDGIGDSEDFLPIHNLLFLIIIAACVIASLVAVMMFVKKRRIAQASFDGQETPVSSDVQPPAQQPVQEETSSALPPPPKRLQK